MTAKERILNALTGKAVDRVPYAPFLTYWWEAQPDDFTKRGELEFLLSIGADPVFRGHHPQSGKDYEDLKMFKTCNHDCEIETVIEGYKKREIYKTSKGQLVLDYKYSEISNSWFLVTHPVKDEEGF